MLLVSSYVPVITWLCSRVTRFQSRPINWPLLTIESPVAQWLEHPTRSRRIVGSNPIWGSDFSEFSKHLIYHVVEILLVTSCYRNWDKRRPDEPVWLIYRLYLFTQVLNMNEVFFASVLFLAFAAFQERAKQLGAC